MASICFNCKKPAFHRSANCPYVQEYARCPSCNKVAFNKTGHEYGCSLREQFVSTKNDIDSNVFEVEDIFTLEFRHVAELRIVNENRSIEIGAKPVSVLCDPQIAALRADQDRSHDATELKPVVEPNTNDENASNQNEQTLKPSDSSTALGSDDTEV